MQFQQKANHFSEFSTLKRFQIPNFIKFDRQQILTLMWANFGTIFSPESAPGGLTGVLEWHLPCKTDKGQLITAFGGI